MAALGATDLTREISGRIEYLVDPGARTVQDACRGDTVLYSVGVHIRHGVHRTVGDIEAGDFGVRVYGASMADAIDHILNHKALGKLCLAIVVPTSSPKPVWIKPRLGRERFVTSQHFAVGHRLVVAQQIV